MVRVAEEVYTILKELVDSVQPHPQLSALISSIVFEALQNPGIMYVVFHWYFRFDEKTSWALAWLAADRAFALLRAAQEARAHEKEEASRKVV